MTRVLSLLLFLWPGAVLAQTGRIGGTVRDAGGLPLPGVNVVAEGTGRGAATDLDGRYRIDRLAPGTYTLTASAIGYERQERSVTLSAGAAVTVDFVLAEAMLLGGEVVVTASRRPQRFAEVPVSIAVLQPRELEDRNIVALDDALRTVPGVQMADNQVNIRGSSGFSFNTGSRVLLLLDGLPLLSPDRESIPFDALPLAQVERIEVVKGPGSALYGSGALGGVINVLTRDFPELPETRVRLFGGAYAPVRYAAWRARWDEADQPRPFGGGSVTHARRFGAGSGAWVNVAYRQDAGYLNEDGERTLDLFAKLGWRPRPPLRLALLGGWTWRRSDGFLYWNGLADPLNPGTLSFADVTGANDNQTNTFSLLPSLTHAVGERVFYAVRARLVGALIQPLEDDGTAKPLSSGTAGVRYGGEVQLDWIVRPTTHLTLGASGDALATASSFFQPADAPREARSQPEGAVFAQLDHTLGPAEATAGLRFDAYRIDTGDTVTKLSPRLALSLPLAEGTALRAAYGQGFRVPGVGERFVNNRSFLPLVPNLDLRPEESTSYEAGLRSVLPIAERGALRLDAAVFWNTFRRLVEPTFVAEEQAFQFVNLTRARIRGAEATLEAATADERWRLRIGYTALDADDRTTGQALVFRSRHLVKAALAVPLVGPLFAGLDLRYASPPERVDTDFARFVRDARTATAVRVVDARLGAAWRRWRLTLLVENVLDRYYVERPAILAPPRHATLQLVTDL